MPSARFSGKLQPIPGIAFKQTNLEGIKKFVFFIEKVNLSKSTSILLKNNYFSYNFYYYY